MGDFLKVWAKYCIKSEDSGKLISSSCQVRASPVIPVAKIRHQNSSTGFSGVLWNNFPSFSFLSPPQASPSFLFYFFMFYLDVNIFQNYS